MEEFVKLNKVKDFCKLENKSAGLLDSIMSIRSASYCDIAGYARISDIMKYYMLSNILLIVVGTIIFEIFV